MWCVLSLHTLQSDNQIAIRSRGCRWSVELGAHLLLNLSLLTPKIVLIGPFWTNILLCTSHQEIGSKVLVQNSCTKLTYYK